MANYIATDAEFIDVANKIRAKTGGSSPLTWPTGFENAIESISGMDNTVVEFSQENSVASAYIAAAEVAYAADPSHSTEIITEYENDSDPSLEKPLGKALVITTAGTIHVVDESTGIGWNDSAPAGTYTVYNLIPGHVYRWWVQDSNGTATQTGRLEATGALRMIYLQYPHNWRDIGGWSCDGGVVKYGLFYRGAQLSYNGGQIASAADIQRVRNLGIKYELDLRTLGQTSGQDEIPGTADDINSSIIGADVYYLKYPYSDASYVDIVNLSGSYAAQTAQLVKQIVSNMIHGEPTFCHCQAGADRTAVIASMIEGLLGVSQVDMDIDFELTSFYPTYERTRKNQNWLALLTYMQTMAGSTLRDKYVQWFLDIGIPMSDINSFRAALIDGTPEVLDEEDYTVRYAITNTLPTGIASNNANTTILRGQAYSATITPDIANNVAIKTLTVRMGGVDISNTAVTLTAYSPTPGAYQSGAINIASVTGPIEIIATSMAATRTNQLPLAVAADGTPYNGGTGFKSGYRLNSSGTETAQSGAYVTGFIPITKGQTIDFEDMQIAGSASVTNHSYCYIAIYDSNKTLIASNYSKDLAATSGDNPVVVNNYLEALTLNRWLSSSMDITGTAFIRISALSISSASAIYVE